MGEGIRILIPMLDESVDRVDPPASRRTWPARRHLPGDRTSPIPS